MKIIDDATRVRVVRAIIGMNCQEFAHALLATVNTLNNWEDGKTSPNSTMRKRLNRLCNRYHIRFLPSGFPIPVEDYRKMKREKRIKHVEVVQDSNDEFSLRSK